MLMPPIDAVLIVSTSARPLACAAHKLGIKVYAIDLFNDEETQACSIASQAVAGQTDLSFEPASLLKAVATVPKHVPVVIGSGFEHCSQLLIDVIGDREYYGNVPQLVTHLKSPQDFFSLLTALDIPHPVSSLEPPFSNTKWLTKSIGGFGGGHVQFYDNSLDNQQDRSSIYYQQWVPGLPYSVLFLANGQRAHCVGYNTQWVFAASPTSPYLYAGAMSVEGLPIQDRLQIMVDRLVETTGLCGLGSVDFMLHDQEFWILEVNPRPTATVELHQLGGELLAWHLLACCGRLPDRLSHPSLPRAHAIVYAEYTVAIPKEIIWPAWVTDRPVAGSVIDSGLPICTILAQGPRCQWLVEQRRKIVYDLLNRSSIFVVNCE